MDRSLETPAVCSSNPPACADNALRKIKPQVTGHTCRCSGVPMVSCTRYSHHGMVETYAHSHPTTNLDVMTYSTCMGCCIVTPIGTCRGDCMTVALC